MSFLTRLLARAVGIIVPPLAEAVADAVTERMKTQPAPPPQPVYYRHAWNPYDPKDHTPPFDTLKRPICDVCKVEQTEQNMYAPCYGPPKN